MKIAIVHGQNHKGSTYHIGKMLVEKISSEAEVDEFFLPRNLNHFCLGCYQCIEDETACPFYEEKSRIMRSLEQADILIFTTPTYCLRASAPMKSFLDLTFTYWMSHRPRECMFHKKVAIISTAAGIGTDSAIKDISDSLFYWGVPYIKKYGISVQAMNWDSVSEKKKVKISNDITRLAKQMNSVCAPKVGFKTKMTFRMMRMMQKAGWGSSPVEKDYWESNGWLAKNRPWKKVK